MGFIYIVIKNSLFDNRRYLKVCILLSYFYNRILNRVYPQYLRIFEKIIAKRIFLPFRIKFINLSA